MSTRIYSPHGPLVAPLGCPLPPRGGWHLYVAATSKDGAAARLADATDWPYRADDVTRATGTIEPDLDYGDVLAVEAPLTSGSMVYRSAPGEPFVFAGSASDAGDGVLRVVTR